MIWLNFFFVFFLADKKKLLYKLFAEVGVFGLSLVKFPKNNHLSPYFFMHA